MIISWNKITYLPLPCRKRVGIIISVWVLVRRSLVTSRLMNDGEIKKSSCDFGEHCFDGGNILQKPCVKKEGVTLLTAWAWITCGYRSLHFDYIIPCSLSKGVLCGLTHCSRLYLSRYVIALWPLCRVHRRILYVSSREDSTLQNSRGFFL